MILSLAVGQTLRLFFEVYDYRNKEKYLQREETREYQMAIKEIDDLGEENGDDSDGEGNNNNNNNNSNGHRKRE